MTRRGLLAALAALPIIGRYLARAEPERWVHVRTKMDAQGPLVIHGHHWLMVKQSKAGVPRYIRIESIHSGIFPDGRELRVMGSEDCETWSDVAGTIRTGDGRFYNPLIGYVDIA